jgi:hypothetical protein
MHTLLTDVSSIVNPDNKAAQIAGRLCHRHQEQRQAVKVRGQFPLQKIYVVPINFPATTPKLKDDESHSRHQLVTGEGYADSEWSGQGVASMARGIPHMLISKLREYLS